MARTSVRVSDDPDERPGHTCARSDEMTDFDGLDVRICCMLEDSTGNVIMAVSFSRTSMMQVDGKVYNTDERLFRLVLRYLPSDYLAAGWPGHLSGCPMTRTNVRGTHAHIASGNPPATAAEGWAI